MVKRVKEEEEVLIGQDANRGPDYGFVWIAPDVRYTPEEAQRYLKKHPDEAINLGDGNGWLYGKKYKKDSNDVSIEPVVEEPKKKRKVTGKRISKVVDLDTFGKTWEEKKKMVRDMIIEKYGEVPKGVQFKKIGVRAGNCDEFPDGDRFLVWIEGLHRQRAYDKKGKYRVSALFSKIDWLLEQ